MIGSINVFTGPMKCGKTKKLIEIYNRLTSEHKSCVMVKPDIDNRFSNDYVVDRDNNKVLSFKIHKLYDLERLLFVNDYIFIDEFEFLSGDLSIIRNAANQSKTFYIAGLNLTSDCEPFGLMGNLMCIADNIEILKGECEECGKPSKYTFCTTKKESTIMIGDSEYKTLCPNCYTKHISKGV